MALHAPAPPRRHASAAPPATAPATAGLRVVRPPGKQRSRVPFFVLCLGILVGAMLGALVLNTAMAATAYEIYSTKIDLARTLQDNQEQAAEVDRLSAPGHLADQALSLGMVQGEGVTYIDLSSGDLIGPGAQKAKDS